MTGPVVRDGRALGGGYGASVATDICMCFQEPTSFRVARATQLKEG